MFGFCWVCYPLKKQKDITYCIMDSIFGMDLIIYKKLNNQKDLERLNA